MRWILILFIFISGCTTTTTKNDSQSGALYVELARNQLQKGHPEMALANLQKAEKIDAQQPQLYNQYGLTYFVFKKYDKSAESFKKALSLDPNFSEARNNYGRVLIEQGRYDEARANLQLVMNDLTYSNQAMALSNYGLSHFRQSQYQKALPYLQKSLKITRTNCHTYSLYGRTLYELKDYAAARPVFDVAVPLCRKVNFDEPHYFAALTYFKSGDKNKGIALMNETLLYYPEGEFQEKAKSMIDLMKLNKL